MSRTAHELAVFLHNKCCHADDCEGWERVGSFGKKGWLDTARDLMAFLDNEGQQHYMWCDYQEGHEGDCVRGSGA